MRQPVAGLEVAEAGSSRLGESISLAALVRNTRRSAVRDVRLRLSFRSASGREVASTVDALPFCPAQADCWWAGAFPVHQFGTGIEPIVMAAARVARVTEEPGASALVLTFPVDRGPGGSARGRAPAVEGTAYIVSFAGGSPRAGIAISVAPPVGPPEVSAPAELLPPVEGEELRGFFYPGRVPLGD